MVFQATNQLQHLQKTRQGQRKWEGLEQVTILGDIQLDELMEEVEGSTVWKQAVSYHNYYVVMPVVRFDMEIFYSLGISIESVLIATNSLT